MFFFKGEKYTLLHATFYRLSMSDKFNFTREQFESYMSNSIGMSTHDDGVLSLVPDKKEVITGRNREKKMNN